MSQEENGVRWSKKDPTHYVPYIIYHSIKFLQFICVVVAVYPLINGPSMTSHFSNVIICMTCFFFVCLFGVLSKPMDIIKMPDKKNLAAKLYYNKLSLFSMIHQKRDTNRVFFKK